MDREATNRKSVHSAPMLTVLAAVLAAAVLASAGGALAATPALSADDAALPTADCIIITGEPDLRFSCDTGGEDGPCVIVSTDPPNAAAYTKCSGSGSLGAQSA